MSCHVVTLWFPISVARVKISFVMWWWLLASFCMDTEGWQKRLNSSFPLWSVIVIWSTWSSSSRPVVSTFRTRYAFAGIFFFSDIGHWASFSGFSICLNRAFIALSVSRLVMRREKSLFHHSMEISAGFNPSHMSFRMVFWTWEKQFLNCPRAGISILSYPKSIRFLVMKGWRYGWTSCSRTLRL